MKVLDCLASPAELGLYCSNLLLRHTFSRYGFYSSYRLQTKKLRKSADASRLQPFELKWTQLASDWINYVLLWRDFEHRCEKNVREKSRECHNHKPQPFPDIKRKRKPTNPNKRESIKHTKSTKISSLFLKRGNRNAKRTEKHKNKMAQGKTYNKSPRRINHKAPKNKTNTGSTALERSVK